MIPGTPLLFHPGSDVGYGKLETPFAAIAAYTNPDGTVNLSAIDHAGNQFSQCYIRVLTSGEPHPDDGTAYAYNIGDYAEPTSTEPQPAETTAAAATSDTAKATTAKAT